MCVIGPFYWAMLIILVSVMTRTNRVQYRYILHRFRVGGGGTFLMCGLDMLLF